MSFSLDLKNFAAKAGRLADAVVGETVAEIATALDERSPVDTGRFRGNWQLGVGSIPSGETGRLDPAGGETVGAIVEAIPAQAAGQVYYLANNVPYAQRLEEGYSKQAPQGIVERTAIEFQQIVDRAVGKAA